MLVCGSLDAGDHGVCDCRCKSAATRDNARMLAAEAAAEAWTDSLVKELQAIPQQAPPSDAEGPGGKLARKVDQPRAAPSPAAAPVWGPSPPMPIGSPPLTAPAVASVGPSAGPVVSDLAATPAVTTADGPAANLQPPQSASLAAETPSVNLTSTPGEPAEAPSVQQPQTAVAASPVPGGPPAPAAAVGGATVQGAVQSNGHACKTECAPERAAATDVAHSKVHSTVAVVLPGGVGAMRIPKEWAAKMLKK